MKPGVVRAILVGLILTLTAPLTSVARATGPELISLTIIGAADQPTGRVGLDADLYLPAQTPAPAILLAHGFGGSKDSVSEEAKYYQSRGFVVLAWSARGFGASTGSISMNSPDREVADVSALIDYLATLSTVVKDKAGDPRVGITGGSYGGAISLLGAALDHRIDALAADITWNNLAGSLFPQSATIPQSETNALSALTLTGPFKRVWTGTFFSIGSLGFSQSSSARKLFAKPEALLCGRFSPEWCAAYQQSVALNAPTPEISVLMKNSSPGTYAERIIAPTLLLQGERDSLFPLSESAKTAAAIRRAHPKTPLAMVWHGGGHDGGQDESKRLERLTADWFDIYLRKIKKNFPTFQVTQSSAAISAQDSAPEARVQLGDLLPIEAKYTNVAFANESVRSPKFLIAPAGAAPSAVTALPGFGAALSLAGGLGAFLPGQSANFLTAPLKQSLSIIGSSQVRVHVTSTQPDATLFFSLIVKSKSGRVTQPNGLVAPVQLINIPATGIDIDLELPSIVAIVVPGDQIGIGVSTTDLGYSMPNDGRIYSVSLASTGIEIPTLEVKNAPSTTPLYTWPAISFGTFLLALLWIFIRRPRHLKIITHPETFMPSKNAPLVEVAHLGKEYGDGYKAVNDLSFTVERGQVLGLLGPNGAGKTTTLRMLMGLIFPTHGEIRLNSRFNSMPVYPGSPALADVGSFVEGPGFLPHLNGKENLELYWRATGRSEDPDFENALQISGLGTAVKKKVRTYSQGMRQRLAIAQAMLGKPDLLVLDEPTNGLDPTQIKAMRDVLRNYASSGRTVIVSSHLLAEVEQTCSHVVVMHRGELIAWGTIEEILHRNGKRAQTLEDIFMDLVGDDTEIGL